MYAFIHGLSPRKFNHTVVWALVMSIAIVIMAAALGRAARNFSAALIDKPDVALYLLLPDEGIGRSTLLRSTETRRDYLAQTKEGPKLITLERGPNEWFVSLVEPLHE